MDKKKVKELIDQVIGINLNNLVVGDNEHNAPINKANALLEEAIKELSKSDWVSVEDRLPEYEENVWVRDKDFPDDIYTTYRYKGCEESYAHDRYGFKAQYSVTHWKPIEKLEE